MDEINTRLVAAQRKGVTREQMVKEINQIRIIGRLFTIKLKSILLEGFL